MTNKFLNAMTDATNYTITENGALAHKTTKSALLDLFAMGAAMRKRSDEDIIVMFRNAFAENPVYALKCLFYIRDVRGGQGERRFFRVCMRDLAKNCTDAARRNLKYVPEFGRWDDLYCFVGTPLEKDALEIMKVQLALDVECKTPSLLAKWLKSENTSSKESRRLGNITRTYLGMSHKQYRKTLSILRERINVLERLMSEGRWDEIEFDKIPSKAGMKYKNAFARNDLERAKNENVQTYAEFAKDETKSVNAKTLYPYECVHEALKIMGWMNSWRSSYNSVSLEDTQRLMTNKYWDNLEDYFNGKVFNGLAIVDTSGSMSGTPIEVAISLGLYCAEKAQGPFHNHFMSFSSRPNLIKVEGVDFCDKVHRITGTDWGCDTNVEAAFDLILSTAVKSGCTQDELPQNLIVISDMEFNSCVTSNQYGHFNDTLFEKIAAKFTAKRYTMPHLVFWNVDARQNNIPMRDDGNVTYVSGFSPVIYEMLMSGKTGYDLMMEKLDSERYAVIQ